MFTAPEDLKELPAGLERLEKLLPGPVKGLMSAIEVIESPGIFERKVKLSMCISVIAYHRCEDRAAREKVLEDASIAMAFGAGTSMGFTATHIFPAIDRSEKKTA